LICVISFALMIVYFLFVFRKEFKPKEGAVVDTSVVPAPTSVITSTFKYVVSSCIFLCAVVLLVTHAQTGLTVATIGSAIAVVTLIFSGKDCIKLIKRVDYKTMLFFIGLFVVVGGLEQTGILTIIAEAIAKVSGGNAMLMVAIIIWVSGIASAFIDNIPFAATMVPVIKTLAATQGIDLTVLAWSLAMGTDIGGSATPIGASANVVGTSMAAKAGHPISWKKYLKCALPATIIVLTVSTLIIWFRYL